MYKTPCMASINVVVVLTAFVSVLSVRRVGEFIRLYPNSRVVYRVLRLAGLFKCSSQLDLLAGELEPDDRNEILLEPLPRVSVEPVTELAVVVHLAPTVAAPFAACQADQEITLILLIVDVLVLGTAVRVAGSRWETVDLALMQEAHVLANPRLRLVKLIQRILLLVLPLHMLLLVCNRVPPHVEESVGPVATSHEE